SQASRGSHRGAGRAAHLGPDAGSASAPALYRAGWRSVAGWATLGLQSAGLLPTGAGLGMSVSRQVSGGREGGLPGWAVKTTGLPPGALLFPGSAGPTLRQDLGRL